MSVFQSNSECVLPVSSRRWICNDGGSFLPGDAQCRLYLLRVHVFAVIQYLCESLIKENYSE